MEYEDDIRTVRLLMGDADEKLGIYSDEDIGLFLETAGGSVYRAAALALRSVAANEAYTLKVVTVLDVRTDGASTAAGILNAAKELEDLADAEEGSLIVVGAAPSVAPRVPTHLRPWWEALK